MLNTEKIAVMTKAAIYEGKEGLQDDRVISYFETDYLLKGLFGSLITYTVAFLSYLLYTRRIILRTWSCFCIRMP